MFNFFINFLADSSQIVEHMSAYTCTAQANVKLGQS